MKNFVPVLFGFLLMLSITACEEAVIENEVQESKSKTIVERPQETITLQRAHEMYKAYQNRYDVVTNFRNGLKDASSGWHSIDFYKDYIAYLEAEAAKVGIPISGLRMYYVAYPEDVKSGQYSGYQTYIYVPTYYKNGSHIAFDPLHIGDDGVPLPIHDIIVNGDKGKYGSLNAGRIADGGISSIANMGEMCKPNCPSDVVSESN